jgi:hypothetical protein
MATKTQSRTQQPDVEAAAERIRNLNERIIDSAKKAGGVYLDTYEKSLKSIADFQETVGGATGIEWISSVANSQASFTRSMAEAYTKAARETLN